MVSIVLRTGEYLSEQNLQAIPLMVEAGGEHQCVGVLYLERREGTEQETDHLLFELVARYVSIVVFNAVVKLATKYRDIELAHDETRVLPGKTVCCMCRTWCLITVFRRLNMRQFIIRTRLNRL